MSAARRGNCMEGFAHCSSLSSRKYGRPSGPRQKICDQLWIPCSHSGASFRSRKVVWAKGCASRGQPSSSRLTWILDEMELDIWLPDQISGPPTWWRSAYALSLLLGKPRTVKRVDCDARREIRIHDGACKNNNRVGWDQESMG